MGQGLKRSQPGGGGGSGDTGTAGICGTGMAHEKVPHRVWVAFCRFQEHLGHVPPQLLLPVLGAELPVGLTGQLQHPHPPQPRTVVLGAGDLRHPCWDWPHDHGFLNVLNQQAVSAPNPGQPWPLSSGFLKFLGTQWTPWAEGAPCSEVS